MSKIDRRYFIRNTAALSTTAFFAPSFVFPGNADGSQVEKWLVMMKDPVYDLLKGKPDLDQILGMFPRQKGEPAFDPKFIEENLQKLKTIPEVNSGHPFLDQSIKVALAHIDATFQGNYPKYGVGQYAKRYADGFPPTIIATVDALSSWGIHKRAAELFNFWLSNFVIDDGTIDFFGPSVSEYGQLLHTAAILEARGGTSGWLTRGFPRLNLMAEYLLRLHADATKDDGLISGVPESDTRHEIYKYFHNNAWVVKGLEQWADLCEKTRLTPSTTVSHIRQAAQKLKQDTLSAIRRTWPVDPNDWWLPARLEDVVRPRYITETREASYTNYRYWLELLSSGILPEDMANRLVDARLNGGGQFCGMTRFMNWLDDWPLTEYLYGLWRLGRKNDFLISLYGHVAYSQCEGHLTAYEQFNFPGDPEGSKKADYCLPCQLVTARAGRLINKS
jgi:hypothetical protein